MREPSLFEVEQAEELAVLVRTANQQVAARIAELSYLANYVAAEDEQRLLASIDALPWSTELSRRVQHYGYKYDYRARGIDPSMHLGELPIWLQEIAERLKRQGHFDEAPDQVIVNEYEPGQGIAPHIDCEPCFGDTIASLSLASTAVMDFASDDEKISVFLERRSLVVLKSDARYRYTHAIAKRKQDAVAGITIARGRRVSLTFRKVVL